MCKISGLCGPPGTVRLRTGPSWSRAASPLDGWMPAPGVEVRAATNSGRIASTATDQDGYYFFPGQPSGQIVSIRAQLGARQCFPRQGRRIEIGKDEAELDIELGRSLQFSSRSSLSPANTAADPQACEAMPGLLAQER